MRPTSRVSCKSQTASTRGTCVDQGWCRRHEIITDQTVCVYTISVITSSSSDIGVVGAVLGGDGHADMSLCGPPFFSQLKQMEAEPILQTSTNQYPYTLMVGGDMSNILEMFGLKKASSHHPCIYCIVPKDQFGALFYNPEFYNAATSALLRSRGQIIMDARGSTIFGTKNIPISPIPSDPCMKLIYIVLICVLHMRMRLTGNS